MSEETIEGTLMDIKGLSCFLFNPFLTLDNSGFISPPSCPWDVKHQQNFVSVCGRNIISRICPPQTMGISKNETPAPVGNFLFEMPCLYSFSFRR
jgi:hypothetical protein